MKLETILPYYKTLQFQVEELTEQLEEQQQVLQQQQQEREILRRNSTQTTQQIELLEKRYFVLAEPISTNYSANGTGEKSLWTLFS